VPTDELIQSIRGGDVARLVRIPGVGKKTGERIVLELREKLGAIERSEPEGGAKPSSGIEQDVISALLNLGCTRQAAEAAVRQAKSGGAKDDFESIFRAALEKVNR
jgi:Holliday junction DNA helicase RuvA